MRSTRELIASMNVEIAKIHADNERDRKNLAAKANDDPIPTLPSSRERGYVQQIQDELALEQAQQALYDQATGQSRN
jgi:hypothetical protein